MARSSGIAKFMKQKRVEERNATPRAPQGFDILLADLIVQLELNDQEIAWLGKLTATRRSGLAHAILGNQVWYRKGQVERLLAEYRTVPTIFVDESAPYATGGVVSKEQQITIGDVTPEVVLPLGKQATV